MHFGKIPKKIGYNLAKIKQNSDKIFKNFQNFAKNQQKFQHFLTKKLRLENGAKETNCNFVTAYGERQLGPTHKERID